MHKILAATCFAIVLSGCTTSRNFEPLLTVKPEPAHAQPIEMVPLPPPRPGNCELKIQNCKH
jgi:hypothetical protein